jgi:hypothetical protein
MKQHIKVLPKFPSTLEEMKVAIQAEWDKLEPVDWNKYIDSTSTGGGFAAIRK